MFLRNSTGWLKTNLKANSTIMNFFSYLKTYGIEIQISCPGTLYKMVLQKGSIITLLKLV